MRRNFYILLALALLLIVGVLPLRSARKPSDLKSKPQPTASLPEIRTAIPGVRLTDCLDDDLGIHVLCDYGWDRHRSDNSLTFMINDFPSVNFNIIRIDSSIVMIQQLDREKLKGIGQYEEGFVTEEVKVAGLNAIKVKAFSKADPKIRLLDYYVVYDQMLYGVMFSVNPKEEWDGYKFLFDHVLKNFRFIENE